MGYDTNMNEEVYIDSFQGAINVAHASCLGSDREVFGFLITDIDGKLIESFVISTGNDVTCDIDIRELVRLILVHNGYHVIFFHNHPSGSKKFSKIDIDTTKRLCHALAPLNINVLDHYLFADGATISMLEEGLMEQLKNG